MLLYFVGAILWPRHSRVMCIFFSFHFYDIRSSSMEVEKVTCRSRNDGYPFSDVGSERKSHQKWKHSRKVLIPVLCVVMHCICESQLSRWQHTGDFEMMFCDQKCLAYLKVQYTDLLLVLAWRLKGCIYIRDNLPNQVSKSKDNYDDAVYASPLPTNIHPLYALMMSPYG